MTNEDIGRFAATLTGVCELFDKKPSKEFIEIYWSVLKDRMSLCQFQEACSTAAATSKFMPKPAELLEAIGASGAKAMTFRTAEAWEAVRTAMDRYDYTANVDFGPHVNAVVRNLGGWRVLCDKSIPDLVWVRKEFEKLYEAFDGKEMGERGMFLPGAFRAAPVVRVAIGGVAPPKMLPARPDPISDVVRELADGKALR